MDAVILAADPMILEVLVRDRPRGAASALDPRVDEGMVVFELGPVLAVVRGRVSVPDRDGAVVQQEVLGTCSSQDSVVEAAIGVSCATDGIPALVSERRQDATCVVSPDTFGGSARC